MSIEVRAEIRLRPSTSGETFTPDVKVSSVKPRLRRTRDERSDE
jgi:hypothetical protein